MGLETVLFLRARLRSALYSVLGEAARARAESFFAVGPPPDLALEYVRADVRALLAKPDVTLGSVKRIYRTLQQAYAKPPALLEEQRAGVVTQLTEQSMEVILQTWIHALEHLRARVMTDMMFLLLLDDAMLPPMDPASKQDFNRRCRLHSGLTGDEVREGLRELRRRLPGGLLLHPDVADLMGVRPPEAIDA